MPIKLLDYILNVLMLLKLSTITKTNFQKLSFGKISILYEMGNIDIDLLDL